MIKTRTKTSLGFAVFDDHMERIALTRPCRVALTISPNSYGMATKDPLFKEALRSADYLLLDGVYFALGRILRGRGGMEAALAAL